MWQQTQTTITELARRIGRAIVDALPGLLAMAVLLAISLVLAWLVKRVVRRLLSRIELDRRLREWGFSSETKAGASMAPSVLLAGLGFWAVLAAGVLLGLAAVDIAPMRGIALRLLPYVPNVVIATLLFVVGLVAARFLERSVLISAVNAGLQSARLLGLGVRWLVQVLATAMALRQLSIGGDIVVLGFGILFGGIVLAMALALGLGARDMIARSLERHFGPAADRSERELADQDKHDVQHL